MQIAPPLAAEVSLARTTAKAGLPAVSWHLETLCRKQMALLASQPSVVCVRLAYRDAQVDQRQHLTEYAPGAATLAHLEGETWLPTPLNALEIQEIALECDLGPAYFCALWEREQDPEYLLVLARAPLTPTLQQFIQNTVTSLRGHLTLYAESVRQRQEVHLLEQVVQRLGHQLRNPLALIALYAENLRRGLPEGSAREQAQLIGETVGDLSTDLTKLIYCSQSTCLCTAPQDLRLVLTDCIQGLQPWLTAKQIQVHYPKTPVLVAVDRLQIKQVFDNLLHNALYFSPEQGVITWHWQVSQEEVAIDLADQGPGLSPEDLAQVFTPFYTRRPGGTGLGLAVARKIVLDHQGRLWASNLPEGGAQFSLTLPHQRIP
ncbi:sensor histidine kinase [Anthocerotibacter panamensis]|uniref:sensor histidine kinase n=1 Tax=Anthocerotibacter panamensis TaxID=2857077 RepID=UPI001C40671E|nr:HAMP domain-containing sensor histidine kinase [Anthocerotibacter panamensis]